MTGALGKQKQTLKALLSHLKANIKSINEEEAKSKAGAAAQIEKLTKRLEGERRQLNSSNLTTFERQLLLNRTRTEEQELKYWSRSRQLEHGVFHSSLKMTHGLMAKAKAVINAYEEVMSGHKLSPKAAEDLKALASKLPKH